MNEKPKEPIGIMTDRAAKTATAEMTLRLVAELDAIEAPILIGPLAPLQAFQLAGLVQLAARHPKLSPQHRTLAADLVDTVRAYFVGKPALLEVLAAGDKAEHDV